ncbi:hypothetical protein ABUW04_09375 [Streptacidiphilus sp. N1-10]|uniref:Uncharacterized protein n=1 Tax=Streptacidiphilus jeojiensis TaxID=3229225 RepID=A0ABV6XKK8_9ACTN
MEYERHKAKLDQLVTDYATDLLTRQQFTLAKGIAEAGVQEAREALDQHQDDYPLSSVPSDQTLRETWESAGLEWRRSVIRLVVERVIIHPGHLGYMKWHGYRFNPDHIEIVWKV